MSSDGWNHRYIIQFLCDYCHPQNLSDGEYLTRIKIMLQKQSSDLSGLKQKGYILCSNYMCNKRHLGDTAQRLALPVLLDSWWVAPTWYYGKWKYNWEGSHEQYMPNLEVIQFTGQNSETYSTTESQEVQLITWLEGKVWEVFGEKQ